MSDIAVKLENVSKFYKLYKDPKDRLKEALHPLGKKYHRKFYALNNINLEVKKGEILGIVGRNGSGKSTLLKLVSGIIQPSSGKIEVKGKVSALLELGSGLNPEFTGMQNIYFSGTMMGFTRKEMEEKIEDIVSFADIGDFIHQPLKTYSSGMKARLGFALAINMEPDILILDEVLGVGDELFKRKCYAKMEDFFKSGCSVIYVSHSINTVNEICSRAIFLDKGELILEGPPKFVTMHYQKFLYVETKNSDAFRNEIIQLNKDEEKKKRFAVDLGKKEIKTDVEKKPQIDKKVQGEESKAFYIPNFKPKSTVITKNEDVEIYDIYIRTLDGKKVNMLVMNEEYVYRFKIKFNIDAVHVATGSPFKTEKGFIITNAHLKNNYIEKVTKGSEYLIEWSFKCVLLPGTYYTNASVGANVKSDLKLLVRIVDAYVFKVQPIKNLPYGGIIHCYQHPKVTKINSSTSDME
ncbi:MAG: ABC transporter ATP-binding protein [Candidatus Aminicenantes bacterium]|jgi:lipopolysaccharide transport system ATP-binding protein